MQSASRLSGALARLALALVALATLASCGSGAVSSPPPTVTPGPLSITPATATLYSDLPTSFIVTGGNGSYIVTSSDQAVVPVVGAFTGNTLTVVPNAVANDTTVTLTVRDTSTTTPVTATLTVKPRTVTNTITVTPSATQPSECGNAVCSGGDAEVKATLMQNGVPLAGHSVRFDVVSGDVRIVTSSAGLPETLGLSGIALSDASGTARIRVRALVDAPSQTALLQVTDINSGAFQRVAILVAQSTGNAAGFFVSPSAVKFTGPTTGACANGVSADVFVFGGTPPYTVSNTNPQLEVSTSAVGSAGGSFRITARGTCVADPGLPIVVRDSQGRTATTTVSNVPGSETPSSIAVAPSSVTLTECTQVASVTAVGGTGNYFATSGSNAITVTQSGATFSIQRAPDSTAPTSPVAVGISDGRSTANVTVTVQAGSPAATTTCH